MIDDRIIVKRVPIKPRFVLVYEGEELVYEMKSFNKVMCWKSYNNAHKFLEENDFRYFDGTSVDKNKIKIVELMEVQNVC